MSQTPTGSPPSPLYSAAWVRSLPPSEQRELARLLTPRLNRYIPPNPKTGGPRPHPPQAAFLLLSDREALYGGAAGGGKSDALLMSALQYVDVPGYHALILRRKYVDLIKADGLIPRAHEWLQGTDARWNEQKHCWTFPSGATLEFGHCEHENNKYDYQGSAWQFIGFDEVTSFTETQYEYVGLSRARRLEGSTIPLRTRATANPGGPGHDWVKARFIDPETRRGRFIPARLDDNPSLDGASYRESLQGLTSVERERLLNGNWDVRPKGPLFERGWFEVVDEVPKDARRRVRAWDLAATEASPGKDPDWTAGCRLSEKGGVYYVEHLVRFRKRPKDVEASIQTTAKSDTRDVRIGMEQEPGASGVATVEHYAREVLKGYSFKAYSKTKDKVTMAELWQPNAERGEVKLVRGRWNADWLDEVEAFPFVPHDDQVDATSLAFHMLATPEVVWR